MVSGNRENGGRATLGPGLISLDDNISSGDVSDEARRNIPTVGDRVSEVGSRDSS
jgi:hypothetical protein